jgi:hypothetical protein
MILYHYTTAEGLQGIIKDKSIWASDYRFLSDAAEFNYGLKIFQDIFIQFATELPSDVVEVIKDLEKDNFATPDFPFSVLIASFCECGDLLSQWRGYNGAIGYAIGFNADWLEQRAKEQDFDLISACYKPEKQQQTIVGAFDLLKESLRQGENPSWKTVKKWWPQMLVSMARLKREDFKEEREWRLVRVTSGWKDICTRTARSGLVPYLPVKLNAKAMNHLSPEARNIGIERIIVGPALLDQQKTAVDALLASRHMRGPEIEKSRIPYIPNK